MLTATASEMLLANVLILVCCIVIGWKSICVLEAMTPQTRVLMKAIYSLQLTGCIALIFCLINGLPINIPASIFILGAGIQQLGDPRIYPPRTSRFKRTQKHKPLVGG